MADVNKSRLRTTSIATMKKQEETVSKIVPRGGFNRPEFHTLVQGNNIFRIRPGHDESESFIYPRCVHWLEIETTNTESGKTTTSVSKRPVFNSRIHGKTDLDVIESYIAFVRTMLPVDSQDPDDKKFVDKVNAGLNGWKGKDGKWNNGLAPQTNWIMYADKYTLKNDDLVYEALKLLEISNASKDKLNNLAAEEAVDVNEVETPDPFSDPATGMLIDIYYDKDAKPADRYSVDFYEQKISKTRRERVEQPLTDEQIDAQLALPSLYSMYEMVYKYSDFELAVKGLKYFDAQYGIGAFEEDEWTAIMEGIAAQYSQEEEKEEKQKETKTAATSSTAKKLTTTSTSKTTTTSKDEVPEEEDDEEEEEMPEEEDDGDEFDNMDRDALKVYIVRSGLNITVKKSWDDDTIRNAIRELVKTDLPFEKDKGGKEGLSSIKNKFAKK